MPNEGPEIDRGGIRIKDRQRITYRQRRAPVRATHNRRHTLSNNVLRIRPPKDAVIRVITNRMGVNIDEAGSNDQTTHFEGQLRVMPTKITNGSNPISADGQIGDQRFNVLPAIDRPAQQQYVEGLLRITRVLGLALNGARR